VHQRSGTAPNIATPALVLVAVTLCGVVSVLHASHFMTLIWVAIVLTLLELGLLAFRAEGFTAPMIPVAVINAFMITGTILWPSLSQKAAVSAILPDDQPSLQISLLTALTFTGAFTIGSAYFRPPPATSRVRDSPARLSVGWLVGFGCGTLLLAVLGSGRAVIYAPNYLTSYGPEWASILSGALAGFAILALSFAAFQPGRHTAVAVVGLIGWGLVLFAQGTRQLAVLPSALLIGRMLGHGPRVRRIRVIHVALVVLLSLMLAQLSLTLRGTSDGVGLLPFLSRIAADPRILLEFSPQLVLGNILFAAPLTAHVAQLPLPPDSFWTSVTPAPSGWTNWSTLAPLLRVNIYTPYNGLGELAAHGRIYLVGYGLASGFVITQLSRLAASLPGMSRALGTLLLVALTTLFAVTLLQYNLRSDTRLVWYCTVCLLALKATSVLTRSMRRGPREVSAEPSAEVAPSLSAA
jgi:hypothetical protein